MVFVQRPPAKSFAVLRRVAELRDSSNRSDRRSVTVGRRSVTGAGDYVAEGDPDATVEFCQLHLPDRVVVGRAGVHFDAG
jgi:hypothetical protein